MSEDLKIEFGRRLVLARERASKIQGKKIKSSDVADIMGVPRSSYCNWETGYRMPNRERVIALAKLLNTSSNYLLAETDDPRSLSDLAIKSDFEYMRELVDVLKEKQWVEGDMVVNEEKLKDFFEISKKILHSM